jgi:hypothetical protein
VRFLLASLHRAAYRRQIEAARIPLDHAPDVVDVRCPRCDALYVAERAPDEEAWDLEALEWAATVQLDAAYRPPARRSDAYGSNAAESGLPPGSARVGWTVGDAGRQADRDIGRNAG